MASPYKGLHPNKWLDVTRKLVEDHPLSIDEIADIVLSSWKSIFASRIGKMAAHIGKEIFPKPQIMGFFLHELIPLELAARYPSKWRGEISSGDKDIVYIPDDNFSIEVKTSSNPNHIFGNRSYAQEVTTNKKVKSGYYLAVNFQKFSTSLKKPNILLVRFGWLDSSDWMGQKAATGQQSRLSSDVENYKLLEIYKHS
jgi:hypothetical protein